MKKKLLVGLATGLFMFGMIGMANAITITEHSASTATVDFTYSVSGTTIDIYENWTNAGNYFLEFTGLTVTSYIINKHITNSTSVVWTSLANELLDPAGQPNDTDRDPIQPGYVPLGYTTSNDRDGLSFAQGFGIPRTSVIFPSLTVDELSDARDFIDFYGANLNIGITDHISYGILDQNLSGDNQPFLLSQRPNTFSTNPVPEPATMLLLGTGIAGLVGTKIRRKKK